MNFLVYSEKLRDLQYFIKNRSATSVCALADKLEVSERTVRRMVESLRLQGVEIQYCKKRRAYFLD